MTAALFVSCEHASWQLPPGLDLGVDLTVLTSHVSWDEGAFPVAHGVARALEAPLHLGRFSRLYVDLNRSEEREDVVPSTSFGVPVPGNHDLPATERERRLGDEHRPYREAIHRRVEDLRRSGRCLHLSVHSFTPQFPGQDRDFEAGILFDPDRPATARIARRITRELASQGLRVRDNEPYSGTVDSVIRWLGFTYPDGDYHGIGVEISQALVPRSGELARFAAALVGAVCRVTPVRGGLTREDAVPDPSQPSPGFEERFRPWIASPGIPLPTR